MTLRPGTSAAGAPRWGYQTSIWQRRQPAFWLFAGTLVVTGLAAVGQQLEMISFAPEAWLLTLALLAPYAIPVILVVYWLDLYEREPLSILGGALLWGGLAATTLSIYTNSPLAELIFKLTADPAFTQEWSAALTAPFVEETFKGLGVILLVSIARAELDDVLDGFVWGAMVGIGFLLVEDVFYFIGAYAAAGGSYEGIAQIFFVRIIGAGPYSHFLYTGLIGMGVAYYHTRTDRSWSARLVIGSALAAAGVAAHFVWNSPLLVDLLGDGAPVDWLVYATVKGLPMLIGLALVIRLARNRERRWFERFAAAHAGDGTITADELHELASVRRRWRARRAAGARLGPDGARLKGRIQRQQINLAMVASRAGGDTEHPDLAAQRNLVRSLKAEYSAMPERPAAGVGVAGDAGTGSAAGSPPPPPPTAWRPTHLVPDSGMAAWAAPDPSRPPLVNLGGRLELVVIERAGDWARVGASNGWSGWVDGRRLVPRS